MGVFPGGNYVLKPKLLHLPSGREGGIAMAVGTLDFAIFSVDDQLRSLITADLTSGINCLGLGVPVTAGALTAASKGEPNRSYLSDL